MKKAKIMLMAVAIVGVVGGALAFKTSNFNSRHLIYWSTVSNQCTNLLTGNPTTAIQPVGKVFTTTTFNGQPCTVKTYTTTLEQ